MRRPTPGGLWTWRFTHGQQWTAGLALLISTAIISFGLPGETVVEQQAADAPARPISALPGFSGDAPAPAPAQPPPRGTTTPGPSTGPGSGTSGTAAEADATGADGGEPPAAAASRPTVVAVVRPGGPLPGGEPAIAEAFVARAQFDAVVVELSAAAELCDEIAAAGEVVVSSAGLPADLRSCLVARGATVISYDEAGEVLPTQSGGQVVSTRRGTVGAVSDLVSWARSAGELGQRPGLVVSESLREQVDPALEALQAAGFAFHRVEYLPDAPTAALDILQKVRSFQSAGVDVVAFAATPEHQGQWVQLETPLGYTVRHLVADVGDSIVTEDYPSGFTGTAYTALRTPWWEREEGETPEQEACRTEWEAAAPPTTTGGAAELLLVYTWCLHLWYVVEPALGAVDRGTPFATAVREQVVRSPLTSDLGPLAGGGYGPGVDVVLAWDGGCGCWAATGQTVDRR
jgi:hypothetical protein